MAQKSGQLAIQMFRSAAHVDLAIAMNEFLGSIVAGNVVTVQVFSTAGPAIKSHFVGVVLYIV